jgi:hypothetical protein
MIYYDLLLFIRPFLFFENLHPKVMTGELDDMFNAELNNLVPGIWTKDGIGYPCLKPLNSWFEDMELILDAVLAEAG